MIFYYITELFGISQMDDLSGLFERFGGKNDFIIL